MTELRSHRLLPDDPTREQIKALCHDFLVNAGIEVRALEEQHGIGIEESALHKDVWCRISCIIGSPYSEAAVKYMDEHASS